MLIQTGFLVFTAPTEPLLCKFADGGQKKRQNQSKYTQNGRPWPREGEVSAMQQLFSWGLAEVSCRPEDLPFRATKKSDCTQNTVVSHRERYMSRGESEAYNNVQSVKLQEKTVSELGVDLCAALSHREHSCLQPDLSPVLSYWCAISTCGVTFINPKSIYTYATRYCYSLRILPGDRASSGSR